LFRLRTLHVYDGRSDYKFSGRVWVNYNTDRSTRRAAGARFVVPADIIVAISRRPALVSDYAEHEITGPPSATTRRRHTATTGARQRAGVSFATPKAAGARWLRAGRGYVRVTHYLLYTRAYRTLFNRRYDYTPAADDIYIYIRIYNTGAQ